MCRNDRQKNLSREEAALPWANSIANATRTAVTSRWPSRLPSRGWPGLNRHRVRLDPMQRRKYVGFLRRRNGCTALMATYVVYVASPCSQSLPGNYTYRSSSSTPNGHLKPVSHHRKNIVWARHIPTSSRTVASGPNLSLLSSNATCVRFVRVRRTKPGMGMPFRMRCALPLTKNFR